LLARPRPCECGRKQAGSYNLREITMAIPSAIPLRWRRIAVVAIVLAAGIAAALLAPVLRHDVGAAREAHRIDLAEQPHPLPATEAEQAALIGAYYMRHYIDAGPVVLDQSLALCVEDVRIALHGMAKCGDHMHSSDSLLAADVLQDVPLRLRRELVLANKRSVPMPLSAGLKTRAAPYDEFLRGGYEGVTDDHPGAVGILQFSRAVLTPDRQTAVFVVMGGIGKTSSSGSLMVFVRGPDGWTEAQSQLLWMS
jgi:hypothetical protein